MTLPLPSLTRFLVQVLSVLLLLLGTSLLAQGQTIRYVKPTGTGDGSSWDYASGNLQAMINASAATDQVWVAAGTYKPTTGTDRTISFSMKAGVIIYGGFAGSETSLSQRPAVNLTTPSNTILSGDIDNSPADNSGNSYHVISNPPGLTASAVLDGFAITGGNANGTSSNSIGGGMCNDPTSYRTVCSPTVRNCLFEGNSASFGGAMYNPGNTANTGNIGNSDPNLTNCSFKGNSAAISGGAMYNQGVGVNATSNPMLTNCSFQNNSAPRGGAMYNYGDSFGTSNPVLTNCSFQNNSASEGGAMYSYGINYGKSKPVLTNCSFQNNSARFGGALYSDGTTGGWGRPRLTNCVVFGTGQSDKSIWNGPGTSGDPSYPEASYSFFEPDVLPSGSIVDRGNNLSSSISPFTSASSLALNACSPAINTGSNTAYVNANGGNSPSTDLAGNSRFFDGGRIDMGAYEYQAARGLTITVPSVSTAREGTTFSQSFVASGGAGPYDYRLWTGSLPMGLSLAANGTVSGTPAQAGSFTITVYAENATGCSGESADYVLQVASATPIRYVRAGASGSGNSWADASGDLQSQINFTGAEQVWVATGTYKPTTTTNRSLSFSMKNGVPIYGGFAGNETALDQRVLSTPLATILSGDIGTAGDNADNSYHVINNSAGLTSSAVLDGFLIMGGNANGSSSPDDAGGGMINNGSGANNSCSPLIRNCLFLSNTAADGGGAIHNAGYTNGNSNPILINCAFQSNAASRGGAIYNDGSIGGNSNPSLTNCSFQANLAPSGGAMGSVAFQGNSRPVLTNCVVWGNGGASTFFNGPGAFITTSYSLFESSVTGYSPGTGNLTTTTSPFASTTTTLLNCGSAAIDAGDPATPAATVGPIDLGGNARFFNGGRIDMGAYEGQGNSFSVAITATPSLTITLGQSATLIASAGFGQPADAFVWSTGATSNSIVVSVAGPYSVTAATTAGCSATASVTLRVNPSACGAGLSGPTWTGCLSTDWNTAGNWASGAVPTATDDVVIPSAPANQPVLSTPATAKSVEVRSGASLSITAAGSLTINNSKSLDGTTTAFSNRGTVQNAGQLVLGNTATIGQIGFWNFGIANNAGGQISIDRSTDFALLNSSGTFTNTGAITIGSIANAGIRGLQVGGEALLTIRGELSPSTGQLPGDF